MDLTGDSRRRSDQSGEDYAVQNGPQEFVYRVDAPAAGTWTVRIMPHNTVGFGYKMVRDEAAD